MAEGRLVILREMCADKVAPDESTPTGYRSALRRMGATPAPAYKDQTFTRRAQRLDDKVYNRFLKMKSRNRSGRRRLDDAEDCGHFSVNHCEPCPRRESDDSRSRRRRVAFSGFSNAAGTAAGFEQATSRNRFNAIAHHRLSARFFDFFSFSMKPPHFDRGINGWFVRPMMRTSSSEYDPSNSHRPLHFYVLFISDSFGRNMSALHMPVTLVSIASVLLTLKFEHSSAAPLSVLPLSTMAVSPVLFLPANIPFSPRSLTILFSIISLSSLLGLWKFGTTNLPMVHRAWDSRHGFDKGDLHPSSGFHTF